MAFTSSGPRIWPVPADWADSITETLEWGTDLGLAPLSGVTQHRSYRDTPRRSFSFSVQTEGQQRRVMDMLLAGYSGVWLLPIWPDMQQLAATLSSGSSSVPCVTAGYDFVAGGKALIWRNVNVWEVVTISTVESDHLALTGTTGAAWATGDRLYPLRSARVQDGAEEALWHDSAGVRKIDFDIAEVCDWPVLSDLPVYLTHPVLATRTDWGEDVPASYARIADVADNDAAFPVVFDLAGIAMRAQQTNWILHGRAEHTYLRSLVYTLRGRLSPIWVPTFAADLLVTADIGSSATNITVEWAGYTLFGAQKPNRRDIRIELFNGTVYYRRITASSEGSGTETLTISSALGAAVSASSIRVVSFMTLSTLASDQVEIEHVTDAGGVGTATLGFLSVTPDV